MGEKEWFFLLKEIYNMYTDLILTIYIYFSVGTDILCVVGTTYYASSIYKSSIVTDRKSSVW